MDHYQDTIIDPGQDLSGPAAQPSGAPAGSVPAGFHLVNDERGLYLVHGARDEGAGISHYVHEFNRQVLEPLAAAVPFVGGGLLVGEEIAEGADAVLPTLANLEADLAAREAAAAFTETGELSPELIDSAEQIINAEELGNPAIPEGFAKYETQMLHSPSGPFDVHFYMNPTTGEVFYGLDYKVMFRHGAPGGKADFLGWSTN